MIRSVSLFVCLVACITGNAQRMEFHPFPPEETIANLVEAIENEDEAEDLIQNLQSLLANPVSINSERILDLWTFGLISEYQWMEWRKYQKKYKIILSVYELESIPGFTRNDLLKLIPFIHAAAEQKQNKLLEMPKYSSFQTMEVRLAGRSILEQQAAYRIDPEGGKLYQGYPPAFQIQLKYTYGKRLEFRWNAESDPGEKLEFANGKYGFDHHAWFLSFKDAAKQQELIAGNFKAGFGQGLVFDNAYSSGFSLDRAIDIKKFNRGIRPYAGNDENNSLFGIAYNRRKQNYNLAIFVSSFRRDAAFEWTSDSIFRISSLPASGLHRTSSELAKRKQIAELSAGSNFSLKWNLLHLGFSLAARSYYTLGTDSVSFNRLDFVQQYTGIQVGKDYQLAFRRFHFFGEWASNEKLEWNQLHGLIFNPLSNFSLSFLYRRYLQSDGIIPTTGHGQLSNNRQEIGWYSGISWNWSASLQFLAFADYARNLWLRYRVNAPDEYRLISTRILWTPDLPFQLYLQFRRKKYPLNTSNPEHFLFPGKASQQQLRLHCTYYPTKRIRLQNRIEVGESKEPDMEKSYGILFMQDIKWNISNNLTMYLRFSLFETDHYQSRIYISENDAYQSLTSSMLYGSGERCYLIMQFQNEKGFRVAIKLARNQYNYINKIGSAGEEITGNHRTELRCMMSYRWNDYTGE